MLLYYIRHGDPVYDPDSLTELGEKQADVLSKRLVNVEFDEIYSSSSNRAKLTAKPTCEKLHKPLTELDWANEKYACREFGGKTAEGKWTWCYRDPVCLSAFREKGTRLAGEEWYELEKFKGYGFKDGILRVRKETYAFLEKFGFRFNLNEDCYEITEENDKKIALFAHGGFGTAFLSTVLAIPYPAYALRFSEMGTSNITVIEFTGRVGDKILPRLLTYSNDAHLYAKNLPIRF